MAQCTAKDLIGTHVGDTEDNVKKKLNEARGGVLLIDEARNETVMLAVACCQGDAFIAGVYFMWWTLRQRCPGATIEPHVRDASQQTHL